MLGMLLAVGAGQTVRAEVVPITVSNDAVKSENATWTAETQTFSWTADGAYVVIWSGDGVWSEDWSRLIFTAADLTGTDGYRLDWVFSDDEVVQGYDGFTKYGSPGEKAAELESFLQEHGTDVKEIRLVGQGASGSLSFKNSYLISPVELTYDDNGVAVVSISEFYPSGNISIDKDGVVTGNGTGGSLTLYLGDVDFSNLVSAVTSYDASSTSGYTDIFNSTTITTLDKGEVNSWYTSKANISYTDADQAKSEHVNTVRFNFKTDDAATSDVTEGDGSMKLNSITFTKNVTKGLALTDGISLNTLPYFVKNDAGEFVVGTNPTWNLNVSIDKIFGDCDNVEACKSYADVSHFGELRITQTEGTPARVWFFNADNSDVVVKKATDTMKGYSVIDLAAVKEECGGKAYLVGIKSENSWIDQGTGLVTVTALELYAPTADYMIYGEGDLNTTSQQAISNPATTVIDATGLTGSSMVKVGNVGNPNCLFIVKDAAKLSNESNVLVLKDGAYTCENLTLTAASPFRAPAAFTATNASMTKSVSKASAFGTLVLPYDAALPEGCKAHKLTAVTGNTVSGEALEAITANEPLLISGAGTYTFSAENVTIQPEAESMTSGLLTGVYTNGTYAPQDSYVLQKQSADDAATFHKVAEADKQPMTPFSAYLTVPAEVAQVNARLILDLGDGATAVDDVQAATEAVTVVEIYDLSGCRVDAPVKGINLMKMSDGTVKKVIVK